MNIWLTPILELVIFDRLGLGTHQRWRLFRGHPEGGGRLGRHTKQSPSLVSSCIHACMHAGIFWVSGICFWVSGIFWVSGMF